ncbi:MAG: pyrimidine/purine nucleoside phosphorylase [Pseudohongiella sp.]|jgi:purine/pyrimidine-nucleoside phosphorylase|nr:pyrimidine/purine nucleoside phosphorylase [Pseudohongiella sp.]
MTEFKNVSVQKESNVYFDGKVTSRTITFADGSTKTLGVMLPGEYEFNTQQKEIMEILSGELDVLLPDQSNWSGIVSGKSFDVPADCVFKVRVHKITNYCCSYID